jgi:hypothetical protein
MSRSFGKARYVATILVTCSVVVALDCAKNVSPRPATNWLPDGVINDTLDFQRKIAAYPVSSGPHHMQRKSKCFLDLFCSRIDVKIEALGNTVAIDPPHPPAHGLPVAHLANADPKKTERVFGMLPSTQADYYLWVDRKDATHTRWTLLQVSHTENSVIAADPADLRPCHRRAPNAKAVPDADFADEKYEGPCDVEFRAAAAKGMQASLLSMPVLGAALARVGAFVSNELRTQGGWIECSNGCCT